MTAVRSSWWVVGGDVWPVGQQRKRRQGRKPGEGGDMSAARSEIARRIREKAALARGSK